MRKLATALWKVLILLALSLGVAPLAGYAQPVATPLPAGKPMVWELKDGRVLNPGQTVQTKEGAFTRDYTVEATATAKGPALIDYGVFRTSLTAFSPSKPMPGQNVGLWYVRGTWTIAPASATEKEIRARHSPGTLRGELTAELPFNPATSTGSMEAQVRLLMSRLGGKRGRAHGTFSGNEKFEGDLQLTQGSWQRSPERGGRK